MSSPCDPETSQTSATSTSRTSSSAATLKLHLHHVEYDGEPYATYLLGIFIIGLIQLRINEK